MDILKLIFMEDLFKYNNNVKLEKNNNNDKIAYTKLLRFKQDEIDIIYEIYKKNINT